MVCSDYLPIFGLATVHSGAFLFAAPQERQKGVDHGSFREMQEA